MVRVNQTIIGNRYANCFQACVASYFELPLWRVPNFMLFKDHWWEAISLWFLSQGYDIGYVDGHPPKDGNYYIASMDFGEEHECSHAVIIKDGAIVHDPYPGLKGIQGKIVGYDWISKRNKNEKSTI